MERDADVGIITVDFSKVEPGSRLPQVEGSIHLVTYIIFVHTSCLGSVPHTMIIKHKHFDKSSKFMSFL